MAKPISLQLYTVRDLMKTPEDQRKVIEEIARIGYAGVEGGTSGAGLKGKDYKKFLDDLGLRLTSTWSQPKTQDDAKRLLDDAELFGFNLVIGCWGPDQFKTDDEVKKTAEAFEAAAQLLKPHGLTMCYHNHWWEFEYPRPDATPGNYGWDKLLELAPTLAGQIDCYWASNFGKVDVPALVRKYRDRTPILHVKDGPLVKDAANVAVGKGKMDIPACVNAADPNLLQCLVVELDKFDGDMMDAVRDSYSYLTQSGLGTGRQK